MSVVRVTVTVREHDGEVSSATIVTDGVEYAGNPPTAAAAEIIDAIRSTF